MERLSKGLSDDGKDRSNEVNVAKQMKNPKRARAPSNVSDDEKEVEKGVKRQNLDASLSVDPANKEIPKAQQVNRNETKGENAILEHEITLVPEEKAKLSEFSPSFADELLRSNDISNVFNNPSKQPSKIVIDLTSDTEGEDDGRDPIAKVIGTKEISKPKTRVASDEGHSTQPKFQEKAGSTIVEESHFLNPNEVKKDMAKGLHGGAVKKVKEMDSTSTSTASSVSLNTATEQLLTSVPEWIGENNDFWIPRFPNEGLWRKQVFNIRLPDYNKTCLHPASRSINGVPIGQNSLIFLSNKILDPNRTELCEQLKKLNLGGLLVAECYVDLAGFYVEPAFPHFVKNLYEKLRCTQHALTAIQKINIQGHSLKFALLWRGYLGNQQPISSPSHTPKVPAIKTSGGSSLPAPPMEMQRAQSNKSKNQPSGSTSLPTQAQLTDIKPKLPNHIRPYAKKPPPKVFEVRDSAFNQLPDPPLPPEGFKGTDLAKAEVIELFNDDRGHLPYILLSTKVIPSSEDWRQELLTTSFGGFVPYRTELFSNAYYVFFRANEYDTVEERLACTFQAHKAMVSQKFHGYSLLKAWLYRGYIQSQSAKGSRVYNRTKEQYIHMNKYGT